MDDKPYMERLLGESWLLTVIGGGAGLIALACILLSHFLTLEALRTTGMSLMAAAIAIMGYLARSEVASRKAHAVEAAHVQQQISNVRETVRDEAKDIAAQTAREELHKP